MQWYMDHVFTHVPHLDLVDIGQNVSAIVKLMSTLNSIKKLKSVNATAP